MKRLERNWLLNGMRFVGLLNATTMKILKPIGVLKMATRPNFLKTLQTVRTNAVNSVNTLVKLNTLMEGIASTTPDANDRGVYRDATKAVKAITALLEKVAVVALPSGTLSPAKRGRPPKAAGTVVAAKPAKAAKAVKAVKAAAVPAAAPKKRGRPPKVVTAPVVAKAPKKVAAPAAVVVGFVAPKRRGRPPKAKVVAAVVPNGASAVAPKKRGRPRKVDVVASTSALN